MPKKILEECKPVNSTASCCQSEPIEKEELNPDSPHSARVISSSADVTAVMKEDAVSNAEQALEESDLTFDDNQDDPTPAIEDELPSTSQNQACVTSSIHSLHAPSDHAMASLIAETITTADEIALPTPKKEDEADDNRESLKNSEQFPLISDSNLYSTLGIEDTKHLTGSINSYTQWSQNYCLKDSKVSYLYFRFQN